MHILNLPHIGLASGLGGTHAGCGKAPSFLHSHLHFDHFREIIPKSSRKNDIGAIAEANFELAKTTYSYAEKKTFFISLGGDHSCAIGTWSGVAEAYRSQGDIGLLWIDAHMDAHTLETTESGNIHGMPLAVLLGHGDKQLRELLSCNQKLRPQNIVLIGTRSYEKGEVELLNRLGVKIYFMEEIRERGLSAVLEEGIKKITLNTVGYGISFDLDSVDPEYAPAVSTPVSGGLDLEELISNFTLFHRYKPLAFELVEYNPDLDESLSSLSVVKRILNETCSLSQ